MYQKKGILTTLKQISVEDAEDIVRLRNDEKFNKFLYQYPLTIQEQIHWIQSKQGLQNEVNFKVLDIHNDFVGTISIYNIQNGRGEFGRYIVKKPINAIESELLLLKFCFEDLNMKSIYCNTNTNNVNVWNQHTKLGFKYVGKVKEYVGSSADIEVEAIRQEILFKDYTSFNYDSIYQLINKFTLR